MLSVEVGGFSNILLLKGASNWPLVRWRDAGLKLQVRIRIVIIIGLK